MSWTEERVEELRAHAKGGKSAGVIGRLMGLTRNQVIGKCHRTGIALTRGGDKLRPGSRAPRFAREFIAHVAAKAEELSDRGRNIKQAADALDMPSHKLRGILKRWAPNALAKLSANGRDYSKRRPRTCKSCGALRAEVDALKNQLKVIQRGAA